MSVGGWAWYDDLLTDTTSFCLHIDSGASQQRILFGVSGGQGIDCFVKASGGQTHRIPFATNKGIQPRAWIYHHISLVANTNRTFYVVASGRIAAVNNTALESEGSGTLWDRVTIGWLPFFGDLNPMQGQVGPWAIWDDIFSEAEIRRLGAGAFLPSARGNLVEYWPMWPNVFQSYLSVGPLTTVRNSPQLRRDDVPSFRRPLPFRSLAGPAVPSAFQPFFAQHGHHVAT
jgi:hypothetical protein